MSLSDKENKIISILKINEDPTKIWMLYDDVYQMSEMDEFSFNMTIQSLMQQKILRIGDQGKGLSIALEEKVEEFKEHKLKGVLEEIESEIQEAIKNEDYELAKDLQKIIDSKT